MMEKQEFLSVRKKLNKTQKQLAQLLGSSVRVIHDYEKGIRDIPAYVERHLFFLLSLRQHQQFEKKFCWDIRNCLIKKRALCPAWEFKAGHLCWFLNGIICHENPRDSWENKTLPLM